MIYAWSKFYNLQLEVEAGKDNWVGAVSSLIGLESGKGDLSLATGLMDSEENKRVFAPLVKAWNASRVAQGLPEVDLLAAPAAPSEEPVSGEAPASEPAM